MKQESFGEFNQLLALFFGLFTLNGLTICEGTMFQSLWRFCRPYSALACHANGSQPPSKFQSLWRFVVVPRLREAQKGMANEFPILLAILRPYSALI